MSSRTPILHVEPTVIRWARLTAGVPLDEAARKANVEPDVLATWEQHEAALTARQLEQLADKYKRPVVALLLAEPPQDPPLPVDFRRLPRSRRGSLSPESRLAIRRARRLQRVYRTFEPPAQVRELRFSSEHKADPETAAEFARRHLEVSVDTQLQWRSAEAAIRHWRASLEARGVLTFRLSLPVEDMRAFSLPGNPPVVTVSSQDPHPAQSFSLFHEWCHLLLGESGLCRPNELSRALRGNDEVFCNAFAGAFLVPMDALLDHHTIAPLRHANANAAAVAVAAARAFSVSRFVVLRRLLTARLVSHDDYGPIIDAWMNQPVVRRRSKFGPEPAVRAVSELGRFFVGAVIRAQQRGSIGEMEASEYLSLRTSQLDRVNEIVGS